MAELSSEELEKIVKEEDNSIKPMKEFESPVKSMLAAVFCFVTICAIVLYFLRYGKFISFICLMMLRIVDFLMNS